MKPVYFLAGLVLLTGCVDKSAVPPQAADQLFLNGGVYTLDPARPWAEAVAISGNRIVYVGDNAGAHELAAPDTEITDLTGRMLLPGFHDSHNHLLDGGMLANECDLGYLLSIEQIEEQLDACNKLEGYGEDRWIRGGNWDRIVFPGGRVHKNLLDEHLPDRPVLLYALDGQSAWVNSLALQMAGIDENTQIAGPGNIFRDAGTGEITGELEGLAMALVSDIIPSPSDVQFRAGLTGAQALAHSFGITSLIEPGLDHDMIQPYLDLADRDGLSLRVLGSMSPISWTPGAFGEEVFDMIATREQYRRANFSPDSIKIYIDGVLETGTALLMDPYLQEGFDKSKPYYSQELFDEYFTRIDAAGLQIHVHALGDRGVHMALNAFEAMRETNGDLGNRHHIVHLQLIDSADHARFGKLNIGATFQPFWAYPEEWIMDLNLPVLGMERVQRMYPIASIQSTGGTLVGGSDWYVTTMNPMDAIEVAIRRQDPYTEDGPVLNSNERVDLETMLAAYTINGAYLMKQEDRLGSIQTGKLADLVVLDRNLFEIPATEISDATVLLTLFNGVAVYRWQEPTVEN